MLLETIRAKSFELNIYATPLKGSVKYLDTIILCKS